MILYNTIQNKPIKQNPINQRRNGSGPHRSMRMSLPAYTLTSSLILSTCAPVCCCNLITRMASTSRSPVSLPTSISSSRSSACPPVWATRDALCACCT